MSQQNSEMEATVQLRSRSDELRSFARDLMANRSAVIGLAIVVPISALVLLAPLLPIPSPTEADPTNTLTGPLTEGALLGTYNFERDLLSRTIYGGRTSLLLGIVSVLLSLLAGVPIGLFAGYFGGVVDELLMRFMDVLMSFPSLLFALLILVALGGNLWNAIIAVSIVFTPRVARIVRSSTLSVKNQEFVEAAEARGESSNYIMFGEILPNIASPIIVEASIRVGFGILIGTSLSFLGLGTQPPTPDWGQMIAESRNYLWQSPWYLIWPGLTLGLTVIGFNLLGDGLRDVLDPEIESDQL